MTDNFINFYEEYINQLNSYLKKIDRKQLKKLEIFLKNRLILQIEFFLQVMEEVPRQLVLWQTILVLIYLKKKNKKINFHSLVDNSSIITAISNDTGYENLFLNQLKLYFKKEILY